MVIIFLYTLSFLYRKCVDFKKSLSYRIEPPFMPKRTYRALPLESLYELLTSSVRDMLAAYDNRQDNMIAFNTMKKQVEVIIELIQEKRREGQRKN